TELRRQPGRRTGGARDARRRGAPGRAGRHLHPLVRRLRAGVRRAFPESPRRPRVRIAAARRAEDRPPVLPRAARLHGPRTLALTGLPPASADVTEKGDAVSAWLSSLLLASFRFPDS